MIGERIRAARTGRRLSLAEVARMTGMSIASLSRIETNKQDVETEVLIRLCRVLEVSAAEMIGQEESAQAGLAERAVDAETRGGARSSGKSPRCSSIAT